jgi:hypothetical protein
MINSRRVLAFALLSLLTTRGAAFAQTPAETAAEWGLLGTWRLDCSQPASPTDPDLTYVARNGALFHDRNFGSTKDSNPVLSATTTASGGIEILVKFDPPGRTRQWTSIKRADGRLRTVSNRNVDTDEYSIRDGKFVANGQDAPWQTHCR